MKIQLYKAKRKLDDMEIMGVFLHAIDAGQNYIDSYHIIRPNGTQMDHYTNEIDIETLRLDGFEELEIKTLQPLDEYCYVMQVSGLWQLTTKEMYNSSSWLPKAKLDAEYREEATEIMTIGDFDCEAITELKNMEN